MLRTHKTRSKRWICKFLHKVCNLSNTKKKRWLEKVHTGTAAGLTNAAYTQNRACKMYMQLPALRTWPSKLKKKKKMRKSVHMYGSFNPTVRAFWGRKKGNRATQSAKWWIKDHASLPCPLTLTNVQIVFRYFALCVQFCFCLSYYKEAAHAF